MSLSNAGFDGTVTELPFAYMWGVGAGDDAVESSAAWAVTQGTGRQVSVAAQSGYAFGHGVLSKETSAAILQALSTPAAGGWFLICRHIDWTTNTVSIVALTGPTSSTTIPTVAPANYSGVSGMSTSPGVTYDQPLAWAWVRSTDTTMALFDLRKLPLASRIAAIEATTVALITNVADLDALVLLSATAYESKIVNVDEINANFQAQDGVWKQITVAEAASAAARTTAYAKASGAFLVQGAPSRIVGAAGPQFLERYYAAYNASTNTFGANTAGWYRVPGEEPWVQEYVLGVAATTALTTIATGLMSNNFTVGLGRWLVEYIVLRDRAAAGAGSVQFVADIVSGAAGVINVNMGDAVANNEAGERVFSAIYNHTDAAHSTLQVRIDPTWTEAGTKTVKVGSRFRVTYLGPVHA